MNLSNPTLKDVAVGGALAVAASYLLPKVVKGKMSRTLSGALFTVGGLALLGAGAVYGEKKLLRA
jgi:hypothetical protein